MTPRGRLALVLHAHLPYVRHPEHARFLEEHWLFEAITDCYLPLLDVLRRAEKRGTGFRATVSLSPTLLSMLDDSLLQRRYIDYLGRLQRLCEGEMARRVGGIGRLARWYHRRLSAMRDFYLEDLQGDLIGAWTGLRDAGLLELITTAATHGYLPLLRGDEAAVRAQLGVGWDSFRAFTGSGPDGIWLPECGYYPGLEREIAAAGYGYTILEAHGVQQASPKPSWDVYAPVSTDGLAIFGRDPDSAGEVWSREIGFPGHPAYREYHRDLGFDAETGLLDDFLPPGVKAAPTGIKYFRVTGGDGPKDLYDPQVAARQAARDAGCFIDSRRRLFARFPKVHRPPLVVAPYDAELFGHWWFEGPSFLDALIRQLDAAGDVEAVTLGEYLRRYGTAGECRAVTSSWGEQGYNAAWLRPETGWVHLQLHQAAVELGEMLQRYGPGKGAPRERRLLGQAARSLLLAQSSDWTFHLGRGGGADYAQTRVREQLSRFAFLCAAVREGKDPDDDRLAALEQMDNLFPTLDLAHFG